MAVIHLNPRETSYRMRWCVTAITCMTAMIFLAGCRQDMQDQPKLIPQRGSEFFTDHFGARQQVANTVSREQLREDSYFYTGVIQDANGMLHEQDLMPFPVTMNVLKRGQERFNIYCSPCHSRVGNGLGEIVQRGYKPAANFHDQARLAQPISHYFYVMTHGTGAMPDYSAQLPRWIAGRSQLIFAHYSEAKRQQRKMCRQRRSRRSEANSSGEASTGDVRRTMAHSGDCDLSDRAR